MSDKTRFFILVGLFVVSLVLLGLLNSAIGQEILVHTP
jgi:hypothetical protein